MQRSQKIAGLLGAVAVAAVALCQPAGASTATVRSTVHSTPASSATVYGYYQVNYHSEICVQVVGTSLASAAPLEQQPCDLSGINHSQLWNYPYADDGSGQLWVNYHSGLCAEPQGASMSSGAALLQTTCVTSGANHAQAWNAYPASDGSGFLWVNYHSGLCAHVAGASTAAGARLDQQPCVFSGADHAMVWNNVD